MALSQPTSALVGAIKYAPINRAGRPTTYRARICLGHHPLTGKLTNKELYAPTKREVAKAAQEFLKNWDWETVPGKVDRSTVAAYLATWIDQNVEQWGPGTTSNFRSRVKHVNRHLGARLLRDLDVATIRDWQAALRAEGLGAPTRRDTLLILRSALRSAVDDGLIAKNPAATVKPPRVSRTEVVAPEPEDTAALLDTLRGETWEYAVHVALGTALRRGEVLGLQWADVDWDNRQLIVRRHVVNASGQLHVQPGTKKHPDKSWRIPMVESVARALRAQRDKQVFAAMPKKGRKRWQGAPSGAPEGWVFPNVIGLVMNPDKVSEWFREVADRVGQTEKTFHHLRHDCASYLLNAGVPIEVVSKLLRHAQISLTLETYSHLQQRVEYDAMAEMDRVLEGAIG